MRVLPAMLVVMLALTAPAFGAGGPVLPMQGGPGVTTPGGGDRFVTTAVPGGTAVERRPANGAGARRSLRLRGGWGVPGAANDGSTTGLSADGRRLVLAHLMHRYPATTTRLLLVDAARLRVLRRITLPGTFTVDAVSPTGRWLYLTRYAANGDPLRYEVRAYDLAAGRLLRSPIVDPREPDEKMHGIAVTRVMSPDGRWAYTLYARPSGVAFVHALDTERRTAACIDVPQIGEVDFAATRMAVDRGGARVTISDVSAPRAVIDARTFAVSEPGAGRPVRAGGASRAGADSDGVPLWPVGVALVAALAAGLGLRARRSAPA